MAMTVNGCTTCNTPGTEKYEFYTYGFGSRKKKAVQYDYRHINGQLFSCCAPDIDECRRRRDEWLTQFS